MAVEDNQAGNGKRGWAHISVYIGALLGWSFWEESKKDIINVQHFCASFFFGNIFGTTSKVCIWNIKQLYTRFSNLLYPIFNISSYIQLECRKYRFIKISRLQMSPCCSFLISRIFIWKLAILTRQLWKWQLITLKV